MLWLLLTGQVPSAEQTRQLSRELAEKGDLPKFVEDLVDSYVAFIAVCSARVAHRMFIYDPPLPPVVVILGFPRLCIR